MTGNGHGKDLLQAELERLAGQPDEWRTVEMQNLMLLAYRQTLLYGATSDESRVPALMALYDVVAERAPEIERMELLTRVSEQLANQVGSGNALMPFIFCDPSPGIISTASLNLAQMVPLKDADPLTGPAYLRHIAEELATDQDVRTGVLAGLLLLGDRRVAPLLARCWLLLDEEHRHQLAHARSTHAYAATVDFYLDWLDWCIAEQEEDLFGIIAAMLVNMAHHADRIVDVERAFPIWDAPDRAPFRITGEWTFPEYCERIKPRLLDLAEREGEEKVIPLVIKIWEHRGEDDDGDETGAVMLRDLAARARRTATAESAYLCDPPLGTAFAVMRSPGIHALAHWGIFNPLGPTVSALLLVEVPDEPDRLLAQVVLHPFSPTATVYGLVPPDDEPIAQAVLRLFAANGHPDAPLLVDLPSYVTLIDSPHLPPDRLRELVFLAARDLPMSGLGEWCDRLVEHWGKPWERESPELVFGKADQETSGNANGDAEGEAAPPPDPRDLARWWKLVTSEEHVRSELPNMGLAWDGSIRYLGYDAETFQGMKWSDALRHLTTIERGGAPDA